MAMPDDPDAELLRQFDALVSGMGLDDVGALALVMPHQRERGPRPALRRPPLRGQFVFRVRVDLDGADPAIWRRLDIRSHLTSCIGQCSRHSAGGTTT